MDRVLCLEEVVLAGLDVGYQLLDSEDLLM